MHREQMVDPPLLHPPSCLTALHEMKLSSETWIFEPELIAFMICDSQARVTVSKESSQKGCVQARCFISPDVAW